MGSSASGGGSQGPESGVGSNFRFVIVCPTVRPDTSEPSAVWHAVWRLELRISQLLALRLARSTRFFTILQNHDWTMCLHVELTNKEYQKETMNQDPQPEHLTVNPGLRLNP